MTSFGDFAPLCRQVPSYPWCNLFYRQLQEKAQSALTGENHTFSRILERWEGKRRNKTGRERKKKKETRGWRSDGGGGVATSV
jgi:hypothetical protein